MDWILPLEPYTLEVKKAIMWKTFENAQGGGLMPYAVLIYLL